MKPLTVTSKTFLLAVAAILAFNLIWAAIAIHGINGTLGSMAREIARERSPFESTTVTRTIGDMDITWHRGDLESASEFSNRISNEIAIIKSNGLLTGDR